MRPKSRSAFSGDRWQIIPVIPGIYREHYRSLALSSELRLDFQFGAMSAQEAEPQWEFVVTLQLELPQKSNQGPWHPFDCKQAERIIRANCEPKRLQFIYVPVVGAVVLYLYRHSKEQFCALRDP